MQSSKKEKRIPLSSISDALEKGISQVDTERAMGLEGFLKVRTVKANLLEREKKRLTKKLGPDHPRVSELALKAEVNHGMTRDLSVGIDHARTEVPTVDKKTWVLHGYVRNSEQKGLENLTVALYDEKGNWLQPLGHACTDQRGYFKMSIQVDDDTEKDKPTAAVSLRRSKQVVIHVLDQNGADLYTDKRPLAPELGRVDYREIILGDERKNCTPPPDPTQPKPQPKSKITSQRSGTKRSQGKRPSVRKKEK